MQNFVTWENRYSIGIRIIDDQHKYLLILTNKLYEACRNYGHGHTKTQEKFRETIQSAVSYVSIHFSTEEKLMDKTNYPGAPAHKLVHKEFIHKVVKNVNDFEGGKTFVPNNFVRFLRDWILEHIAIQDKELGVFLSQLNK